MRKEMGMKRERKAWMGGVLGAFLISLFLLSGCGPRVVCPYRPGGGPPPWAPAHGYRAKHVYRYYPESFVYFDVDCGIYFYLQGGTWKRAPRLPVTIRVDWDHYVILEMDTDRPYIFHEEVVKSYPPGHLKKKGKHPWK
jgi:hypothetical protein